MSIEYTPTSIFAGVCGIAVTMALGSNPLAATAGSAVNAALGGIQLDKMKQDLREKLVGAMDAEWDRIRCDYRLPEKCCADLKKEIMGEGTSVAQFVRNFERNEPTKDQNRNLVNSLRPVIALILKRHREELEKDPEYKWDNMFLSDATRKISARIVKTIDTVFSKEETLAILTAIARNRTADREEHLEIKEVVIKTGEHVIEEIGRHSVHSVPISLTTIPIGTNLIGRENDIEVLKDLLDQYSIVSIRADGGVGKTAAALKIINDIKKEIITGKSEYKHLAWITSSGDLQVDLTGLDIPSLNDQNTVDEKITTICDYLQVNSAFLVIDNLDTPPCAQDINLLNTFSGNTKVLITTRASISKLYNYLLEPIDQEASVRLFYKHYLNTPGELGHQELDNMSDREVVKKIVEKSSGNALLIELIAKMACWEYQEKLDVLWGKLENDIFGTNSKIELEVDHNNTDILSESDRKLQSHIRNLYKLSKLDEKKQELMRFFSVFPAETVIFSNTFFWAGFELRDIQWLIARGWIEKNGEGYLIHTLIRGSVLLQDRKNSFNIWKYRELINNLADTEQYLSVKYGYIKVKERIIVPETVCRLLMESNKNGKKVSYLYNNLAMVYFEQGDYGKAFEYYRRALVIREKVFGKSHPNTAGTYNNLAVFYDVAGEYDKALDYNGKALTVREKVLGKNHLSTATTYHNRAEVYDVQREYGKARKYYEKALTVKEKALGKEHPDTATTYNNLAMLYSKNGDYGKALKYSGKALAIFEKRLGKEHPDTGAAYNNIAVVYSNLGDYAKALEFFEKALAIRENLLVKNHPDTAVTYFNLAELYEKQGEYMEALEFYNKALAIREKVFEKDHPYIIDTKTALSRVNEQLN